MARTGLDESRTPRFHASIRFKLIGLSVITIAAIVAVLTLYFPAHEIKKLRDAHRARVTWYGELFAMQLTSAVAFADHETAREVLSSIDSDDDVVAVTLYGDGGAPLYTRGAPSSWVARARSGVIARRVFDLDDRVAVVAPIRSLEGPRGTLVIELSTEGLAADRREIVWTGVILGVASILVGGILSWLIARSFVRRLRAINDIASAIAEHHGSVGEHRRVEVDSSDEIGTLAGAFNTMLARLHEEQRHLEHTKDELARMNHQLETRVEARTAELKDAMARQTEIELELRQAQKLESVGRLAAGVAHEINTPVQFVSDSCGFLQDAVGDVIRLMQTREDMRAEVEAGRMLSEDASARVQQIVEDIELPYLIEQIPLALGRATEGLERVAEIVRSLKEFAYADQKDQSFADLNRAIQSTLMVARNEYKYVADVHTELGELPMVMCHVGELNQVILNIVVNAAHAIEETVAPSGATPERRGTIAVRTRVDGPDAVIEIEDDGCGIPQAIIDKIFDPFFTTKAMGKGTGQGLAIARSVVVEKHRGKLTVKSDPGKGTTFTMRLPIEGAVKKRATSAMMAVVAPEVSLAS